MPVVWERTALNKETGGHETLIILPAGSGLKEENKEAKVSWKDKLVLAGGIEFYKVEHWN